MTIQRGSLRNAACTTPASPDGGKKKSRASSPAKEASAGEAVDVPGSSSPPLDASPIRAVQAEKIPTAQEVEDLTSSPSDNQTLEHRKRSREAPAQTQSKRAKTDDQADELTKSLNSIWNTLIPQAMIRASNQVMVKTLETAHSELGRRATPEQMTRAKELLKRAQAEATEAKEKAEKLQQELYAAQLSQREAESKLNGALQGLRESTQKINEVTDSLLNCRAENSSLNEALESSRSKYKALKSSMVGYGAAVVEKFKHSTAGLEWLTKEAAPTYLIGWKECASVARALHNIDLGVVDDHRELLKTLPAEEEEEDNDPPEEIDFSALPPLSPD